VEEQRPEQIRPTVKHNLAKGKEVISEVPYSAINLFETDYQPRPSFPPSLKEPNGNADEQLHIFNTAHHLSFIDPIFGSQFWRVWQKTLNLVLGGRQPIQLFVFVYIQFILFILFSCFYLLIILLCLSWCLFPLHRWSSVLFFRTDVLTPKFGGVRFAQSFPFSPGIVSLSTHWRQCVIQVWG
jgi:hypothetical protein